MAPYFFVQGIDDVGAAVFGGQWAIGCHAAHQGGGIQPFAGNLLQCKLKLLKVRFVDRAARRHGVAAKFNQHIGAALGHQVKRITQVKTGNRSARAFQLMLFAGCLAGGKYKGGAVQFVLDARGHDADHAFVKVGIEY